VARVAKLKVLPLIHRNAHTATHTETHTASLHNTLQHTLQHTLHHRLAVARAAELEVSAVTMQIDSVTRMQIHSISPRRQVSYVWRE
jgi:hypothetical protein